MNVIFQNIITSQCKSIFKNSNYYDDNMDLLKLSASSVPCTLMIHWSNKQ